MAKTLRTSGDYTIKAGDGFNSGSGTNTITFDSLNVSVSGNLTVGGSSSTISTTNTIIEDNIIELQTGISASSNDSGIIIERGSTGDNAAIIWDESVDSFKLGTTTATGADKSGGITVTAGALGIGALTATTGTFSGAVSSVGHTVEGNITAGSLTTNEITANGSNATLTVASSGTGDATIDAGGDIILDADNADIKLQDGGTEFGRISRITSDLVIKSMGDDKDIILKGLDNSATINALTLDMSEAGAATFNSTVTVGGAMTATSVTANDFTSNGSNADITIAPQGTGDINLTAGADVNVPANIGITFGDDAEKIEGDGTDLTITGNNIKLDVTSQIQFRESGTHFGQIDYDSGNNIMRIVSNISDKDFAIRGNDGGAYFNALTFDMSAAGAATFNDKIILGANKAIEFGDAGESISGDGTDMTITGNIVTIDAASRIILDAAGNRIDLHDNGTEFGRLVNNGGQLRIQTGSSAAVAVSFDSSGNATFASNVTATDITANSLTTNVLSSNGSNADLSIQPSGTGDVLISALRINGTTLDSSDSTKVTIAEALDVTGAVTANAGVVIDNITIDGTEIDLSSGDFTLDVAGDINLDAAGADINLRNAGTLFGNLSNSSNDFIVFSKISDGDLLIKGNDGGATITALTLDMSAAGAATFNDDVTVGDDLNLTTDSSVITFGADSDTTLTHTDGTGLTLNSTNKLCFNDTGTFIHSNADGDLDLSADGTNNDAVKITSAGGIALDANESGSTGVINLDANYHGYVGLKDNGVTYATFTNLNTNNLNITSAISDADMIFRGNDGGSTITALTLDMSAAGAATFNSTVTVGGAMTATSVTANDFTSNGSNADITVAPQGTGDINLTAGADVNIPANIGITFGDDGEKIEGDGTSLTIASSHNTLLDTANDLFLDAGNGNVYIQDDTVIFGHHIRSGNNYYVKSYIADAEFRIQGNDGGSPVNALIFDMAAAGAATFNDMVTVGGSFKKAIHTFTATDAITEVEHAGRTLLLGEVGGNANVVLTLPDATGSGNIYHFIVSVAMGGSTTYKIQVPDADNTIAGQIQYLDEDGTAVTSFPTVAASDTITLNSGTQGGIVGDTLTLIDIAADKYAVSGQMRVSAGANPATPFSAAVS